MSNDADRNSRGVPWLEASFYDLRFAVRGLRRDRAFAVATIAMLALAIGLNVTVFTVMDAMLFRGYPLVQRNDRLVYLQEHYPSGRGNISYSDFEQWRSQAHTFDALAFVGERNITLRDGVGPPADMLAFTVSTNVFRLLGVPPVLGRDFVGADELPGAHEVALLNYRFWETRFNKRADVVGMTVEISGVPATIVGVMPERFDFPTQANIWLPLAHTAALEQRGLTPGGFTAVGRLRDAATGREARAELETIGRRLEAEYPATNRGLRPTVATHSESNSGPDARIIWGSLWVGAWLVLLIACANVANLALVRTMGRWRELSTRIALGAGPRRMVRHVLIENLLLAGMAGALGWWLTEWSVRTWSLATANAYQVLDYAVNSGTLEYLLAITAVAAALCSLAPTIRVLQLGESGALKGDARGVTQSLRGKQLAAGLVAGQMALAIVLLSGAGVLVRSFLTIVNADTGIRDPEHVLMGHVRLPTDAYASADARIGYVNRLSAQLRTVPGIERESISSVPPVRGTNERSFEIEGKAALSNDRDSAQFLTIERDYFRLMEASAIVGRDFNDADGLTTSLVAIVNQSFAATFWPGEQVVGKRLRTIDRDAAGPWRTVVGIAPNIMQGDATRQRFKPLVYVPFRQQPSTRSFYFFVRTGVPPITVARAIRAQVEQLDRNVMVDNLTTLKARLGFDRDYMDPEHSELGKHAAVAPSFAAIALLLAAIGLYAVIAHSVSQRTKEIGIRIAIGAASRDIRRLVFREGLRPVALGVILGSAASLAVNRILQSQLVGVSPDDPATFVTTAAVLTVVALLACYVPSRRALRIDPVVALQND